jgi:uncharacterized protein YdaL
MNARKGKENMTHHRHARIRVLLSAAAVMAAVPLALSAVPASAAPHQASASTTPGAHKPLGTDRTPVLPAPPKPPAGLPKPPKGYQAPTALASGPARQAIVDARTGARLTTAASASAPATATAAALVTPSQARTWGGSGSGTALVVYDTTGTWGWLGEMYAMAAGNLASHFGKVTAEPVASYVAGQVGNYTATIYLGSTYNEPVPAAFLNDVLSTTHPVIWAGSNIWQLTGTEGSAADTAFKSVYGWDPSNSYIDTTDNPVTVSYKGQTFSRNAGNGADVLAPAITTASLVSVLAQANCTATCAPIAQTTGTSFPWAIRSSNLTYVGEIPFSYISESDRYLAFSDLLFPALMPGAATTHQGLVRLEDVDPTANPTVLRQFADYLSSQHVPFSVAVIPQYTDPKGTYNGGRPQTVTLAQAPAVVSALKYMQSKGGTIIEHGNTHQYSNVANPYNGVTGDDAEFFRAQCSTTQTPPYQFHSPCLNTDWVTWTGPLPGDSSTWAAGRATAGRKLFTQAGLAAPAIWETPHYFASAADYAGIDSVYATRYERELFVSGQLSGGPLDYSRIVGQFFPYVVNDVYGEKIIPEDLGNYEPTTENNNPPRTPADIIHNAQVNLAVTQGVASFFFHPTYSLTYLQQIVTGIKSLGYTFVAPAGLPG